MVLILRKIHIIIKHCLEFNFKSGWLSMWYIFWGKGIVIALVVVSVYLSGLLIYFFSKDFSFGKKDDCKNFPNGPEDL